METNIEMENLFPVNKKKDAIVNIATYAMKFCKNKETVKRIKTYTDKLNEKGE